MEGNSKPQCPIYGLLQAYSTTLWYNVNGSHIVSFLVFLQIRILYVFLFKPRLFVIIRLDTAVIPYFLPAALSRINLHSFWIYIGHLNEDWLAIATNLMLLITGVWLIRRGIEDAITHFFYTGVGVLLITALLRYFDLIGDYIGGAVLFMVAAAVLFGAARYWRFQKLQKETTDV